MTDTTPTPEEWAQILRDQFDEQTASDPDASDPALGIVKSQWTSADRQPPPVGPPPPAGPSPSPPQSE
ncbi:hypothetical protein OG453_35645 [Streptomyces sp. NBC_01381]|uniref:hypothetical protein n=1 Tax=Streptomyces sp. NBC_01381 TaxID=2903845 RepID=UPI002251966C|nr:hypothetical protein [Streptomyces sp. NBC_01381]MCX4671953.1 hypothetical protein [Streptomyces sp. NBC_01381]